MNFWLRKAKLEKRTKFQDVEKIVNERMSKVFQELNEKCRNQPNENFEYEDECIEDTEETDMSTRFLRMQKNQLIDLEQNLERLTCYLYLGLIVEDVIRT